VRARGLADKKPGGGLPLHPGAVSGLPGAVRLSVVVSSVVWVYLRRSETFNSHSIARTLTFVKRFVCFSAFSRIVSQGRGACQAYKKPGGGLPLHPGATFRLL